MNQDAHRPARTRAILLIALAYALVGWAVHLPNAFGLVGFSTVVWPSAGIALGALLIWGPRLWPGIWLGALLVNGSLLLDALPLLPALGAATAMATGATLQGLAGYWLARRFIGDATALDNHPVALRFILLCGPLASLVSATIGSATLMAADLAHWPDAVMDWLSWWSGDTIGVLLATPVVLALAGPQLDIWRTRRMTVAVPLVLFIVLIGMAFLTVGQLERDNQKIEFDQRALLVVEAMRVALDHAAETTHAVADFVKASRQIDLQEFEGYTNGIRARYPAIHSVAWIPRVRNAELARYEAARRLEGSPNFLVFETPPDGARVPVSRRSEYFPVQQIVPAVGHEDYPGHDLASNPDDRERLAEIRTRRSLALGDFISTIEIHRGEIATPMLLPVHGQATDDDDGLRGFVLNVIHMDELIAHALQDLPVTGMAIRVYDLVGRYAGTPIFALNVGAPSKIDQFSSTLKLGERNWQVRVTALDTYQFAHRAWYAWATLATGVVVSALFSYFLLVMTGRTARTEQEVARRTAALEAARLETERSSQLLREAVASITQGFTIYDKNDRLVVCNEAYRRFHESSRAIIAPGVMFSDIVRRGAEHGQYRDAIGNVDAWVKARIERHQRADGAVAEQQLGDGRWLMVVEYRTPSGFIVGNHIDITEMKFATAAIRDRNTQLGTIFSLSPDGLVSFDRAGLVKFANPAFLRMTDMSLSEIIGLSQIEFEQRLRTLAETPERWPGLDACFISTKVSHGETPPREQRQLLSLRRPRGAVLELVGVNSDAPSVSRLLYIRDVTHEVEVDRMKSEFLSHAAHELRTPMASIFGFTELLLSQDFDDTTRKDLLQTIHKQTAWLVDIINELLDIARIEARRGKDFNIEAVSLPPLLASVIEALQIDQQRWPLSLQCPDHLPNVRADAAKLRQALTNVLANAVKYSPSGGPINILCATSLANGRTHVNINITDHGIGMTPDQVARVCERFYRADTSGNIPGTGLGMAIVKEILELLGGSVNIQSSPNQGTSIRLSLPTIDIDVASAPATA